MDDWLGFAHRRYRDGSARTVECASSILWLGLTNRPTAMAHKRRNTMILLNGYLVPSTVQTETLKLSTENANERDHHICFEEERHKYFVRGQDNYISCTTAIHHEFPEFNGDAIARAMVRKPDFSTRYPAYSHLMDDDDDDESKIVKLKAAWDKNRDECSALGTKMHRDIELTYNEVPVSNSSPEFKLFLDYMNQKNALGWRPYRTEWIVYSDDHQICGSIDMLFVDADSKYYIRDWKRSKEIRFKSRERGRAMLSHLHNCNYHHYSLQLSIYSLILEMYYGIVVENAAMVVFHPNNTQFKEFRALDLRSDARKIMEKYGIR